MYLRFAIAVIALVSCLTTSNLACAQKAARKPPIIEMHAFCVKDSIVHRLDFEFPIESQKMQVFHLRQGGNVWRVQMILSPPDSRTGDLYQCRGLVTMDPDGHELESVYQKTDPASLTEDFTDGRLLPPKAAHAGYFVDLNMSVKEYLEKTDQQDSHRVAGYSGSLSPKQGSGGVGVVCWIRETEDPSAAIEAQLKKRTPRKDFIKGALAAGWRGKAGEKFVPALIEALSDEKQLALSRYQNERNQQTAFRAAAMDALGLIGPGAKDAVPLLVKDLSSSNETWRYQSVIALGRIGSPEAGTIKAIEEAAAKSDNKQFRAAAEEAIYSIKKAQGQAVTKRDMAT